GRHARFSRDWSSAVCSSDPTGVIEGLTQASDGCETEAPDAMFSGGFAIFAPLKSVGFSGGFGRHRDMLEGNGKHANLRRLGERQRGRELEDALSAHEVDMKGRAEGIAAISDAVNFSAG